MAAAAEPKVVKNAVYVADVDKVHRRSELDQCITRSVQW